MAPLVIRTFDIEEHCWPEVCNQFNESVIVVREYWKMSESQQKTLLSEGVTRHVWRSVHCQDTVCFL